MSLNLRERRTIQLSLLHLAPQRTGSKDQIKQHDSCPLHQSTGRHSIIAPSLRSGNHLGMGRKEPHLSMSSPHMWVPQHNSQPTESRSGYARRMVFGSRDIEPDHLDVQEVDLIAMRFSAKVEKFCSLYREDIVHTMKVKAGVHIPFSVYATKGIYIRQNQATKIAIIPFWSQGLWFIQLSQMSRGL